MTSLNPPKHGTFKVSAICKQGRPFGVRASGVLVLQTGTPPENRLPARISNPLPAILPFGSGNWRTAIERTQTPIALAVRRFISRGPWLICKIRRAFEAAGKPSFLRALVQHPEKSGRSVAQALFLAPAFLPVPVFHGDNMAQERSENAEIKAGNVRNVVR